MKAKIIPPKTKTTFGTPWGELEYVCRKIHYWLFQKRDRISAMRYLSRLKQALEEIPQNDSAIVREEGLALFYQLKNKKTQAIRHRAREIQLTEMLHKSVRKSIQAGEYDEKMGDSILSGRDANVLHERQAILSSLMGTAGHQVHGVTAESKVGHESTCISIDDLVAAKKLVERAGSIEKVREALAALARLR